MYIESKAGGLTGPARIGRVTFSKTGRTIYYRDQESRSMSGAGLKANFYDVATGEYYWISGPKRDGSDRLYGERIPVEIDEDVREEYWTVIRVQPSRVNESAHVPGEERLAEDLPTGRRAASGHFSYASHAWTHLAPEGP
ncbi:MAG: hypothetical protein QOI42_1026 [Frankiaceae bacterium]|jgi:hypothetical protein|nr:hypothetical protein [Frankiaceae bacterium]